jgi:hypothetical protein
MSVHGSLHEFIIPHWDHELDRAALPLRPGDRRWSAQQRSPTRFMESFNIHHYTRIRAMNRMGEVGRVTPCAPSFVPQESVVAAVGAQRTARPTLRFMGSPDGQRISLTGTNQELWS